MPLLFCTSIAFDLSIHIDSNFKYFFSIWSCNFGANSIDVIFMRHIINDSIKKIFINYNIYINN